MKDTKKIFIDNEVAYQYIGNKNYYITKTGKLYSTYIKGAQGKTDISNPHKVAYGQDRDGYYRVVLSNNTKKTHIKIHQIVVNQFLGGCDNNHVINHIDGNKHNNSVENLEIVTVMENTQHAWKIGLNRVELNPNTIPVDIYDNNVKRLYRFLSLAEAAKFSNDISITYIRKLMRYEISFNLCMFKKIKTGVKNTDYYVECYYNGKLYRTFNSNKAAGEMFGKTANSISNAYKSSYPKKINRYTITFPNVSTIESTNDATS